ncbi:MAG: hypothetical protein KDK99_17220, partial [Verrucomicrobiales bacterium]|nr:hypothetical protein [Verrucomicrobiales bacterium]
HIPTAAHSAIPTFLEGDGKHIAPIPSAPGESLTQAARKCHEALMKRCPCALAISARLDSAR